MGGVAPLYIVGAGGMGREALELCRALGHEVAGFVVEDRLIAARDVAGRPVLAWSAVAPGARGARFVAAIGAVERRDIIAQIEHAGGTFETLVHPSVALAPSVTLGEGCIVMPGAVLTVDIAVGAHTIVNVGCTISHDARLGRLVTLSPGVHVAGRVTLEDEVFAGIGAAFADRVRVGRGAVIGAGAVVIGDIPAGVVAVGVPARPVAR